MKIAITGATGYIGNHLVEKLLSLNHDLIVTGTSFKKAKSFNWFNKVQFLEFNIDNVSDEYIRILAKSNKLVHLAWSGLPNYNSINHIENNLIQHYIFLKKLIQFGITDITVTGTCLEYGLKEGCLWPNDLTNPVVPYAIAKDTLRKFLFKLKENFDYDLKWARLFYSYGKGQSKSSILEQLAIAINNGDEIFNMSKGDQLRDYLSISDLVNLLAEIIFKDNESDIYNCSSGSPISIRTLVENYLTDNNLKIKLNLGYYDYPDYEPMAFWGGIPKNLDRDFF